MMIGGKWASISHWVVDHDLPPVGCWPVVQEVQVAQVVFAPEDSHCGHWVGVRRTVLVQACDPGNGPKPHTERRRGQWPMLILVSHKSNIVSVRGRWSCNIQDV